MLHQSFHIWRDTWIETLEIAYHSTKRRSRPLKLLYYCVKNHITGKNVSCRYKMKFLQRYFLFPQHWLFIFIFIAYMDNGANFGLWYFKMGMKILMLLPSGSIISNNKSKYKRSINSTKTIMNYIIVKYKHTNEIWT